jgi:hypothetical protein
MCYKKGREGERRKRRRKRVAQVFFGNWNLRNKPNNQQNTQNALSKDKNHHFFPLSRAPGNFLLFKNTIAEN